MKKLNLGVEILKLRFVAFDMFLSEMINGPVFPFLSLCFFYLYFIENFTILWVLILPPVCTSTAGELSNRTINWSSFYTTSC